MTPKPNGAFRLVSWNVNGLRAILQKGFQDFLQSCEADVVCLQEIKARPDQVREVEWPEGWEVHWNPARRPGYSGVATFTRHPAIKVHTGIDCPEHDQEGRVLRLDFPDFSVVNVYVPNSGRGLARLDYRASDWSPAFLAYLQKLAIQKPVVVCGDMNVAHQEIDLARPKDNTKNAGFTAEERSCFDALIEAGFIDTFREFEKAGGHYTWWSYQNTARERNIGWRIDYFLITPCLRDHLQFAFIWPEISGSDHCPVGIDIRRPKKG